MLLSACSEWFDKRDQLFRPQNELEPVQRRWTAFVSFLAELLLWMRGRSGGDHMKNSILFLAKLLCDCCHDILESPRLGNASEVDCLRSVLTRTGKVIEHFNPDLMEALVWRMRESFLEHGFSSITGKHLLHLIELRASGWKMNIGQQKYYDSTVL
ncbi:MIF4G domain-containing protein-like [Amblyomma americanum]